MQRRSNFTVLESDKCLKDGIHLNKVLCDINTDVKHYNESLEKEFKNETKTWMKGLKERVLLGKEVFRGTSVRALLGLEKLNRLFFDSFFL